MKSPLFQIIVALFFALTLNAQEAQHQHGPSCSHDNEVSVQTKKVPLSFIENKNQWHENVLYKTAVGGHLNNLFLEEKGFTYLFFSQDQKQEMHDVSHSETESIDLKAHAYHVEFLNSQTPNVIPSKVHQEKYNYFIGNDEEKWAPNVSAFSEVLYDDLYEGVDLKIFRENDLIKYEFILEPNTNPSIIALEYSGTNGLEIENGHLKIHTAVGTITERPPYTYQVIEGKKVEIKSSYELKNNTVQFRIEDAYDISKPLIIDPVVVAATLTGTTGQGNFGHTATFDSEGNIYTGGISFGPGYPTTIGAFEVTYNGGDSDIAISKYNSTGTQLIYATYIGGSEADYPHSIIADFNQRLYVYGSSRSTDYPTTSSAVQTNAGGQSDIVVTIIETGGDALTGSTYIGGSSTDGINSSNLNSNYGDQFRGEIIIDNQNNVYIASGTRSADFPIINAFQDEFNDVSTIGFAQDAVVCKLSNDLSLMYWSTFLGGENSDFAGGLRLDDENNVYVVGTAGSASFPTTNDAVSPTWPGGQENAFLVKIDKNGDEMLNGTFWGSDDGDEHGYFLDVDELNQVHIYGQSTGTMPITPGTYFLNPGSRQFLTAFTPDLDEIVYSTVYGTGANNYDFVPVAFMVDKCDGIYFSGYYAEPGLFTSPDAVSNTGDAFYLGVLEPNATGISYGTYYGESNHVDGGTSRFDKSGTVYQAVCSCDWNNTVMNTNSNAWATNQSTSCDVGVFKIDFEIETVTAAGTIFEAGSNVQSSSGCAPFAVDFKYTGQDATEFYWNFGDGSDSNLENPSNVFENAGSYDVFLVVSNPFSCNEIDTVFLQVDVLDNTNTSIDTSFCNGDDIYLDASIQNASYLWHDGFTGSTYQVSEPGTYWVEVDIIGCNKVDTFVVNEPLDINIGLEDYIAACDVFTYTIDGNTEGASSYVWQDNTTTPTLTTSNEGLYVLTVTDENGCIHTDQAMLLFGETPSIDVGPDQLLCDGETYTINPITNNTNVTYTWNDGSIEPTLTVSEVGTYSVVLSDDGCIVEDEVFVDYYPEFNLNETVIPITCSSQCDASISVAGTGGNGNLEYIWSTGSTALELNNLCPGIYTVTVTDSENCEYITEFNILAPNELLSGTTAEDLACAGDLSGFIAATNTVGGVPPYLYSLNNQPYVEEPEFSGLAAGSYDLNIQDANGCILSQEITLAEPPEFSVSAGNDITIELGESTTLSGSVTPLFGQTIEWTPDLYLDCTDCLRPDLMPFETTLYTLTATDPNTGCERTDDVLVTVRKIRDVYIPNAFSPNNDGVNDFFTIFAHIGVEQVLELKVFDRWGGMVYDNYNFKPNVLSDGWNGVFKGKQMNTAVFTYFANVRFLDGEEILYKGDFTLVR